MSKIGKINISIPDKVKVALNGSVLNVDGPLGKKSLNIDLNIFDLDLLSKIIKELDTSCFFRILYISLVFSQVL